MSEVIGSSGWLGGVGWQLWVLVAAVAVGWGSRCVYMVLLDTVPGLTYSPP